MAARGPQNGRRGLERGLPLALGRSCQLSLNKFFDPSAPSMRKVDDGKRKENYVILVATNVDASRPPECQPTGTPRARAKSFVVNIC